MFGPGDALFGTLADIARLLPILPLIGGGYTRLQPVFVEDVAEAIASLLSDPGTVARTYELAGPGVYTLRELVSMTLRLMGKSAIAHTGSLCSGIDPGATIGALAEPAALHRAS
jgi:NADH dehydrogenase